MAHEPHVVKQGEDIISIAQLHKVAPDAIWKDDANTEIRERLGDPYVLKPGDTLQIPPAPEPRSAAIATGKKHTFRRKGVPEKLILVFQEGKKPRAGIPYVLEIVEEKKRYSGKTDGEGKIEHWVQPTSRNAKLTLTDPDKPEPEISTLALGHLDPVTEDSGLRARLQNLGFLDDERANEDDLAEAISAFQEAMELKKITGKADAETRDRLVEAHRC